jgi:hypothetical protein
MTPDIPKDIFLTFSLPIRIPIDITMKIATSEDATPGYSVGNTIFLSQFGIKSIKQSYAAWLGKEMPNLMI